MYCIGFWIIACTYFLLTMHTIVSDSCLETQLSISTFYLLFLCVSKKKHFALFLQDVFSCFFMTPFFQTSINPTTWYSAGIVSRGKSKIKLSCNLAKTRLLHYPRNDTVCKNHIKTQLIKIGCSVFSLLYQKSGHYFLVIDHVSRKNKYHSKSILCMSLNSSKSHLSFHKRLPPPQTADNPCK